MNVFAEVNGVLENKRLESEALAKEIDAWLAKGNKITELEVSHPVLRKADGLKDIENIIENNS
jgi:hypothetical protein